MQMDLSGRRALVTGGSSGIGRATALALAEAGARVIINHWGDGRGAAEVVSAITAASGEAFCIEADVGDATAVRELMDRVDGHCGGLDILVNNAGIVQVRPFLEVTEADFDRIVATDLKGVFLVTQAALPGMLEQGHGVVVNVASELAYLGRALYAPYTAAKGGVLALTRSLAREFAPVVRFNAVAPGPTDTPMLASELAITQALAREIDIPAGRLAQPEEIARTIVFLASDWASFYHGETLAPCGGALMR
jgi:3-oxoacyl-[acyl-carrier protein] reductase